MQTIFIEENLNQQQIHNLCQFIQTQKCKSLEFRRCSITNTDFNELMECLSKNSQSIISLIFNIQMINESNRFLRFTQMLSNCSNLVNLRVHGNNLTDEMFSQLYRILYDHCPKLILLDLGDNRLTNKSIVHICSLILPDVKRNGLEELSLSANRSITNAGWTELFFSISFNSRIRRLAFDYNIFDNTTSAMLSMVIASSRTLTYLDLECCNLTEYVGQLFLTLFTKYPVKLEEICLDKNPSITESTRILIKECLNLKSRQNSISNEQPLLQQNVVHYENNDDSISTTSTVSARVEPVKLKKKKKKNSVYDSTKSEVIREDTKSVSFTPVNKRELPTKVKPKDDDDDIEELLPVEIEPYGTVGRTLYWNRI